MNRWVIFDRDPGWGTNSSDSWTTVVTPIFLSLETWSVISDTRGEITITQGRQVGLAPESCSRIVEAHRGSAWKMANFPNLVGTVTKQSRPSNTHQTASLCSCLGDKWPSFPKASSMAFYYRSRPFWLLRSILDEAPCQAVLNVKLLRSDRSLNATTSMPTNSMKLPLAHVYIAAQNLGSWIWLVS